MLLGLAKQLAKPLAMPAAVAGFVKPVRKFDGVIPPAVSTARQAPLAVLAVVEVQPATLAVPQ